MDQAREALFNVLANRVRFEELEVLDLFGGTGSISLEFISRGALQVEFVDNFPGCVHFVRAISRELGISDQLHIVKSDAVRYLKNSGKTFGLIFMDPPYDYSGHQELIELVFRRELLKPGGWLVLEHDVRQDLSEHERATEMRQYGDARFSFFA
jgi:16S rRNA (guanine(966)-N(2))-methyltransferase RsmD